MTIAPLHDFTLFMSTDPLRPLFINSLHVKYVFIPSARHNTTFSLLARIILFTGHNPLLTLLH